MRSHILISSAAVACALLGLGACSFTETDSAAGWTDQELRLIASLSLDQLPPLPPDPSNKVADDPEAAALGQALFFETRLSANERVSCGTCHLPDREFQDDRPLALGVGQTSRRTMPIAGTAYSPWLFWDGRKDSQWSQALGPLESEVEHGTDRAHVARIVAATYREPYEQLFGSLPDVTRIPAHASPNGTPEAEAAWQRLTLAQQDEINRVFANVGKVIAAFERTIQPTETRFDRYARALASGNAQAAGGIFTERETAGLRLFVGKANCINCHNGPLLTDQHFHNTGVPAVAGLPEDLGRIAAIAQVQADLFNCLGAYSDAKPTDCAELRFMATEGEELIRAFKPPSLRGVADRPPFMHAGQIGTLKEVIEHYDHAPHAPAGHSELTPLNMTAEERAALLAFLETLSEERPAATSEAGGEDA